MKQISALTRRRALFGGLALGVCLHVHRGRAETSVRSEPDSWRIIRTRRGGAALRGPDAEPTTIWGYEGTVPGPLLRIRQGEELRVRLVNDLPEPTSVHWHGLRLPNAMDGVPHLTQEPIAPGATFAYRFTPPDAGTFWYHSHLYSSEQIDRGLYGALIVDEKEPVGVDRDILLIFDDWRLNPDGSIDEASFRSMHDAMHDGRLGEHLTVNSSPIFDIPVRSNERVRLRLLNAANARIMEVRLARHRVVVAAIDGQPVEPYVVRDGRLVLGPGNRIDLIVDAALEPGAISNLTLNTGNNDVVVARIVYETNGAARSTPLPDIRALPANPLPQRMDFASALRVDAPLDGGAMMGMVMRRMPGARRPERGEGFHGAPVWAIAGKAADGHGGAPLFSVSRGRTVVVTVPNRTAFAHAMHIHGHHFRLLDNLDDGWKPFWLDTLVVPALETARIAFVADNPGKWMIHCHMAEHQETGMAAWFEVA